MLRRECDATIGTPLSVFLCPSASAGPLWSHVKTVMTNELPPPSIPRPVSITLIVIFSIAHLLGGSENVYTYYKNKTIWTVKFMQYFAIEFEVKVDRAAPFKYTSYGRLLGHAHTGA